MLNVATFGMHVLGHPRRALLTGGRMARGCELCFPGLKAVIFVTGECDEGCYYCPVDRERFGRTVIYVNDERAQSVDDVIEEVQRQGAAGASITGGDPLADLPLTLKVIRALKEAMGPRFHIHLYTPGRYATPDALVALWRAGLDEIRFHPVSPKYVEGLRLAKRLTGMSVGAEVPIGPGLEGWVKRVVEDVDRAGGDFVNLDELEFAEPNEAALRMRGLRPSDERWPAAEGALRSAISVLEWAAENARVPVHFCPASFKDEIQVANRLRRTSARDLAWHEVALPDGTVAWGEAVGEGGEVVGLFNPVTGESYIFGGRPAAYRALVARPTSSRSPVLCEAYGQTPEEAVRACGLGVAPGGRG